jgi:cell division protein FtsI (penicillin-binding protein 3)
MIANSDIRQLYIQSERINNSVGGDKPMLDRLGLFSKLGLMMLIAIITTVVIILRIVYLNTANNDFLAKQLDSRVLRTVTIPAMRGTISDRNGNPLAVSTPVASVWVDPTQLDNIDKDKIAHLAALLGLSVTDINNKLNQKTKTFVFIKRGITPAKAEQILALGITGIYSMKEYKRFYPYANVTAHVVGFNNVDDNGVEGMEYADNKELLGSNGKQKITRDRYGRVIGKVEVQQNAENGKDVALSIDNKLQFIAYDALKKQVDALHAKGGSAVILDAKTGEVLAMVNMPTYNPNDKASITLEQARNRAAIDIYEPGSIIKPIVVAKALDQGIVKPNTVLNTRNYYVGNKLIKDDHSFPSLDVTGIIQHSSDIGASKIALMLNKKDMWQYYSDIGFGRKVGTSFPGEASGIFRNWSKWYPIDQAEMGFGYGVSVSLLQMARSYTLFTNNGCLLPITFYKATGNIGCQQVIKSDTANTMKEILASTTIDGTGRKAQTDEYTTAGKTGTAHKYKPGGYASSEYYGSFVGFAPAHNPRLIIAVMIDDARGAYNYYGGQSAAPVFAAIAGPALHELGVNPDKVAVINPAKTAN